MKRERNSRRVKRDKSNELYLPVKRAEFLRDTGITLLHPTMADYDLMGTALTYNMPYNKVNVIQFLKNVRAEKQSEDRLRSNLDIIYGLLKGNVTLNAMNYQFEGMIVSASNLSIVFIAAHIILGTTDIRLEDITDETLFINIDRAICSLGGEHD